LTSWSKPAQVQWTFFSLKLMQRGPAAAVYYSKLVLRGEPVLNSIIQAVPDGTIEPPGQPLTLMHTYSEMGRDHYDAVI